MKIVVALLMYTVDMFFEKIKVLKRLRTQLASVCALIYSRLSSVFIVSTDISIYFVCIIKRRLKSNTLIVEINPEYYQNDSFACVFLKTPNADNSLDRNYTPDGLEWNLNQSPHFHQYRLSQL
jgi:hypothetical protein